MSRPIKFRVWDSSNNEWVEGPCEYVQLEKIFSPNVGKWYENSWTFQQFTGLLDKNGREIYEGDIIQTFFENNKPQFKAAIRFDERCGGYSFYIPGKQYRYDCHFFDLTLEKPCHGRTGNILSRRFEVIGNIFENPDLLAENS